MTKRNQSLIVHLWRLSLQAAKQTYRYVVALLIMLSLLTVNTAFAADKAAQQFPDVLKVKVKSQGDNRFDFDVTVSSPYDTPQRYANAFRVSGTDGTVFGERKLLHDHGDEQPFTRDLYGVTIPDTINEVTIQARDQRYGYGGKTVTITLPDR